MHLETEFDWIFESGEKATIVATADIWRDEVDDLKIEIHPHSQFLNLTPYEYDQVEFKAIMKLSYQYRNYGELINE